MTKDLPAYRGYTATTIKNRADIPDQVDMTVSGSNVLCTDVATSEDIANVLGTSENRASELCKHANVNHWSGFGPTIHTISNQTLVNSDPTDYYSLGSFTGYNHTAITPGWITSAPSGDIWVIPGNAAEFSVDVYVGELRYSEFSGIVGITLAIYYGESLMGWASRNFTTASVQDDVTGLYVNLSPWVDGRTYTGKVWLVDDTADFDGTQIVCRVPNTADFTQTVRQMPATTLIVNDSGFTVVGAGCVPSQGRAGFSSFSHSSYTGDLQIICRLFDDEDQQVGSTIEMYNGYYSGGDDYPTTNPAYPNGQQACPEYNWTFVIDFLPY